MGSGLSDGLVEPIGNPKTVGTIESRCRPGNLMGESLMAANGPAPINHVSERDARHLQLIDETLTVAIGMDVELWLRGGWAVDFFLGRITRRHEDIDFFVWAKDASRMIPALLLHAYEEVPGTPKEQQLDFRKWREDLSMASIDRDADGQVVVAGGPWAGAAWPTGMIDDDTVGHIGELRCQVISPKAQIEIKQMMPTWDPRRPRRAKDRQDVELLRSALGAEADSK